MKREFDDEQEEIKWTSQSSVSPLNSSILC